MRQNILLMVIGSMLLEISGQTTELFQIGFGGVRWRKNCDMVGPNFHFKRGPAEKCGTFCKDKRDCKAFTWTNKNGGTCWMTNNSLKFQDGLQGTLCGYITGRISENDKRLHNVTKRPRIFNNNTTRNTNSIVRRNVEARYWREHTNWFGCEMPENANYQLVHALALGRSPDLGNLTFRPGLCGQVLSVDCGFGAIDAVITNSCNIGNTSTCGVQLLGRTWRRLTNNQLIVSFNTAAHCSVRLSTRNPIEGKGPLCFKRPFIETHDLDNATIGVLNTGGRISSSATLAGVEGVRGGDNHWFHFSSYGFFKSDSPVLFQFDDGSYAKFRLGECIIGGGVHVFRS